LFHRVTPRTVSRAGITTPRLVARRKPPATPARSPTTPMMEPCNTKIDMIEPGLAPKVRRMAMSAYFSWTAITRVDTMLKAATATMRKRMMVIMVFSRATARKKLAWLRVQSLTSIEASRSLASCRATCGASKRSVILRRTPVTPSPIW
jgi:hypothetical protein